MVYDLIIIGAGPAGISAGVYVYRNGLNVLILEKGMPGGLLNITAEVANYPGNKVISGPDLAMNFYEHLKEVGVPYKSKEVLGIKDNGNTKTIITKDEKLECKYVLIATGRRPRTLGLDNEKELLGNGISNCALCDAHFFKGKEVAVVGAGNSALEEALHLANVVKKVYIIHRRDELRGDALLQEQVKTNDKIEVIYNAQISSINPKDGKLKSLSLTNDTELEVSGLFVYVGYEPAIDFVSELVDTNLAGYILVDNNYETSCKGIYAVGDIISKKVYQIVTATSEGAVAAVNISGLVNRSK